MAAYPIGSNVRSWGRFYNTADTLVDPTSVFLTVMEPDGLKTTYDYSVSGITKSGTGEYYADLSLTKPGRYSVRWYSTGTNQAAGDGSFVCRDSPTI